MTNLGSLLYTQGDYTQAVTVRQELLDARRETLGRSDPSTLIALDDLAAAKLGLGELEEAVALIVEELAYLVKAHGKGCAQQLRPETRQTAAKIYEEVMKQPELGADVAGYNELVVACKLSSTIRSVGVRA